MLKELNKLIETNDFPPVIFIYGEEEYLVDLAFKNLISAIVRTENDKFNYEHLNIANIKERKGDYDFTNFIDALKSNSMFGGRRIISVANLDIFFSSKAKKNPALDIFQAYLKNPNQDVILICKYVNETSFGKPLKLKQVYDAILSSSKAFYFPLLKPESIENFIKYEFKRNGKEISAEVAFYIRSNADDNLQVIASEIQKLIDFAKDKSKIDIDEVSDLMGVEKNFNIFELTKTLSQKDLPQALKIIQRMSENKDSLRPVITQLFNYFIKLYKFGELKSSGMTDFDLGKAMGVYSSFLREYKEAYRLIGDEKVRLALELLADADERIKSSQGNIALNIQNVLIKVIN